jgi:hypothetical protein
MGERFKQAIEKEKRLEVASRPIQKKKQETKEGGEESTSPKKKKKRKRKERIIATKRSRLGDEGDLEEKDTLEEGINWSDDE